ncbi:Lsr2 family protein [Brachybacterium kimchii]|uniref:Lsr2 family protein n=2 Tax=Brachybacterium kimchii TaxID=2942909 RepID=A0ABY4NCJ9_9MICO|nr:Lsr2 family protein [Brachybacterium kimchii]UQN31627.1 Lsr2 family protein [Brachybacterium kimchii]
MARKTHVLLVDDVDGSEATDTIRFGLDGLDYEIDLNETHAQELKSAVTAWSTAARRTGGRSRRGSSASREETRRIRQWARENGYEVSDRGRVSAKIREAYAKAN